MTGDEKYLNKIGILRKEDIGASWLRGRTYREYASIADTFIEENGCSPSVVEIGTRTGYSLSALVTGSSKSMPGYRCRFLSIDGEVDIPNSQSDCSIVFSRIMWNEGLFISALSEHIKSINYSRLFDIAHVDGNHTYEGVMHECNLVWNVLESGGKLLIDDYENEVKLGADQFLKDIGMIRWDVNNNGMKPIAVVTKP